MKLYFSNGSCSLAVRIVINELDLPCEFVHVDKKEKVTDSGENYLNINSKGAVPAIMTDAGEILTENNVIQMYLCDTNKGEQLLPAIGDFQRYRVLEWANYVSTEIHKGFGPLFNPAIPQVDKDKLFIPMLKKKFDFVNARLEQSPYLSGESFAICDGYLFVVTRWLKAFSVDVNEWPALARFFKEVEARPAVKKSLEQESLK